MAAVPLSQAHDHRLRAESSYRVRTLQVYYDLAKGREERGLQEEVAIVRVEQLAPFPFDLVMRELRRYPKAQIMW